MKRLFLIVGIVTSACGMRAADLDLKDGDVSVDTLAGYDNIVNSGVERRTLTISLTSRGEEFAGTISGNVRLVKKGKKQLTLSGDNTYTGGTQLDAGWLMVNHENALGDMTSEVVVNSDCTPLAGAAEGKVCALAINVQTFNYNVKFAEWSRNSRPSNAGVEGSQTMYNLWPCYAGGSIVLNGTLTGGDISVRESTTSWGDLGKYAGGHMIVTYAGDVVCRNFYAVSRGQRVNIAGKVTAAAIHLSNATTPTELFLLHPDNEIGSIDTGLYASGGGVNAGAENALGGALLYTSASDIEKTAFVQMHGMNQTINFASMSNDTADMSTIPGTGDNQHVIDNNGGNDVTLTLRATQSCTNDWLISGKTSILWNPVDSESFLKNVYRSHTMGGSIIVSNGTFVVAAGCSFSNVRTVVVARGAVFRLDDVASIMPDVVTVELEKGAKVQIPSGSTLGLLSLKYGADYLDEGTYSMAEWLEGGSVKVKAAPVVLRTSTWTAGGGESMEVSNADNWNDPENPPKITDFSANLVFAAGGEKAVFDLDASIAGLVFASGRDFTVSGSSSIRMSNGGISCTTPCSYRVYPAICLESEQDWNVTDGATLEINGQMSSAGDYPLILHGGGRYKFLARSASTMSGPVTFGAEDDDKGGIVHPVVYVGGPSPFGTGLISFVGRPSGKSGPLPTLNLANADLANDFALKGHYAMNIVALEDTTNVIRGVIGTAGLDFAPTFTLRSRSKLTFSDAVDMTLSPSRSEAVLWTVAGDSTGTECLEFDGRVTYPYDLTFDANFGDVWFNADTNTLRCIDSQSFGGRIHCGVDYAFADGSTAFKPCAVDNPSVLQATALDLHGHSQHFGNVFAGNALTRIDSTSAEAELKFTQTEDVAFAGEIGENVTLVKAGAGKFTVRSVGTNVRVEDGVLAFSNANVCSARKTVLTLEGAGKVFLPEGVTRVKQLRYKKGESYSYVAPGTHDRSSAEYGHLFADASVGSICVRQNENEPGLMITVR